MAALQYSYSYGTVLYSRTRSIWRIARAAPQAITERATLRPRVQYS